MKHIALGMELADYYDHGIARGVIRYAKGRPDWLLYGHGWMFSPLDDLADWTGDGVIARIEYAAEAELASQLPCPVVDVANSFPMPDVHVVSNGDVETGRLAGRHFKANGFRNFAFCGVEPGEWSRLRLQGFREEVGTQDLPVFERPLEWWLEETYSVELALFLSRLPKPVSIFACNDKAGLRVSSTCNSEGIAVPDQVAILGVDNEDIPCELANPSLSSIALQLERIGATAAARLNWLLGGNGGELSSEDALVSSTTEIRAVDGPGPIVIPPLEVVERRSTSAYASSNPLVVEAFRLIRSENGRFLDVSDLVAELSVSRRTLESQFKHETGRTLHDAITLQRIRIATRLLRTTNLKVEAIAQESGFGSVQRFFAHFKRHTGTTPNRFRMRIPPTP
ncbi:MAG: DNA-binding transcriptional regulator [Spirochaetota bacterium]